MRHRAMLGLFGTARKPIAYPPKWFALFNGTDDGVGNSYSLGYAVSADGTNWVGGPKILEPIGSGFEATVVKDPSVVWDGHKFVCYYAGYNATSYKIARATSNLVDNSFTRYASNPVLSNGAAGSADEVGCEFPVVVYDVTLSPPWKMWYTAQPSGWTTSNPISTVAFADSSDGITWTKHGTVIPTGAASSFNEKASLSGCVIRSGATWYVFFGGFNASFFCHSAYVTCTDPADSGTYSAPTQLSNLTGTFTFGGLTWRSNLPRGIVQIEDGSYLCYLDAWSPSTGAFSETCCVVASADLTSWPAPTGHMIPRIDWHTDSTENPSVIYVP